MSTAMPAQRDISIQSVASLDALDLETKRVIFFAGDAITSREKFEMPNVKAEGIYLPQIRTLPKNGEHAASKGMVHRCQFTALQADMKPEWEVMLPPGERKHYPQAFISEAGTISGWIGSNAQSAKKGEFQKERHGDVRYHKTLPGSEVRKAQERSQPNGIGGVVEIEALKGASAETINAAQYFFFPEWGESPLPPTVRELEAHIKERIAAIADTPLSPDQRTMYQRIGADMLKSCTTFRLTALETVEKDDVAKADAAKNGLTAPHSAISEHLLPQIEYKRKGELLAGNATETAELVREMRADRLAQGADKDADRAIRQQELEIERLKLELALANANTATVTHVAGTPTVESVTTVAETPVVEAKGLDFTIKKGDKKKGEKEEVVEMPVDTSDDSVPF